MLGRLTFALGNQFDWRDRGVHMTQMVYADRISKCFHLSESKPVYVPMQKRYKPTKSKDSKSTLSGEMLEEASTMQTLNPPEQVHCHFSPEDRRLKIVSGKILFL